MALKQKTVVVGEDEFLITTFPTTKGLKILKQIIKVLGPAATQLGAGEDSISKAVEKLVENLDEVDVEVLIKDIVSGATKGNVSINFDSEFSGDFGRLLHLTKEVVEFNFGSVFTLLGLEEPTE